jgi:hypothetical protein
MTHLVSPGRRIAVATRVFSLCMIALITGLACDETRDNHPLSPSRSTAEADAAGVVYGPVNDDNPFEAVGLGHNDILHAGLSGLHPIDTTSADLMAERFRTRIREWSSFSGYDGQMTERSIQHATKLLTPEGKRLSLRDYDVHGLTEREARYLGKIGEVLSSRGSFADIETALLDLEAEILAEQWPSDQRIEALPRIAISVAKHSFAYWKHVMTYALDIDKLSFGKGDIGPRDVVIEAVTACDVIVSADVMGACAGAEYFQAMGPGATLAGAIIVGGASSLGTAALVYHKEIGRFFKRLFGCDR